MTGGLTLQNTNLNEGTTKLNAQNSALDYIAMQFRLNKRFGLSVGVLPYSNVGYYFNTPLDDTDPDQNAHNYTSFRGDGGIHQAYLGVGAKVVKGLSVGANVSFLFGNITRISSVTYPYNTEVSGYTELEKLEIKDIKLDFGVQYDVNLNAKNGLTLGAVYSPRKNLHSNAWTQINNTATKEEADYGIPDHFGVGLTYQYDKRLTVSADYTLEKWGSVAYRDNTDYYCDRPTYAIGAEFLPDLYKRKYLTRVRYRIGAYYSEPYYKIQGIRATKEYGVSFGFGLPVLQSSSIVNISGQYVRVERQASNLISENYLKLNIGLTFNETWFMKRRVR